MFNGVNVSENSLVVREAISNYYGLLLCVTDYTPCCTGDTESCWYWNNSDVLIPLSNNGLTMSRGVQVVQLHRPGNPTAEGIFWCRIRVAADTFQNLYVGVYGSTDPNGDGESVHTAGCVNVWR